MRAAPANLPILSDRWWEAACELIGITAESALDDSALPDDVVLEDVTGRVDRDGIGAHWRLKQSRRWARRAPGSARNAPNATK